MKRKERKTTKLPPIVSPAEWKVAREKLLVKEKAATRSRDALAAERSIWTFLDLTPLGRQENWEDSPAGWPQTPPYEWWRRHDEYGQKARKARGAA
jgi:predicted dithiol-disulfide oxidoreductase (DUF899 family)